VQACTHATAPLLLELGPRQVLARVEEHGDLFAETISLRQLLPSLGG
jgi:hypothetical protein